MNSKRRFMPVTAVVLIAILAAALWMAVGQAGGQASVSTPLIRPQVVHAQAGFLDAEAGMAGYTKLRWATPVDQVWPDVRRKFATIEKETNQYVIGTVRVPQYYTWWDPHVYLDKDGWLVMYYPKTWTPVLFLDIKGSETTTFQTVAKNIAAAGGASYSPTKYYHFEFPQANRIVVVSASARVDTASSFTLQVPSGIQVLSKSYVFWSGSSSWYGGYDSCGSLVLGETTLAQGLQHDANLGVDFPRVAYLKAGQVPPDVESVFILRACTSGSSSDSAKASMVFVVREP